MKHQAKNSFISRNLTSAMICGSLLSMANAVVLQLDLSSASGPNAGLGNPEIKVFTIPTIGSPLTVSLSLVHIDYFILTAIGFDDRTFVALNPIGRQHPINFVEGDLIDSRHFPLGLPPLFSFSGLFSVRERVHDDYVVFTSPDFGSGSYVGFQTRDNHFGWLEVTWTAANKTFEIHSGAVETVPGVSIQAGIIPEPSTALFSLSAVAASFFIRRRKSLDYNQPTKSFGL